VATAVVAVWRREQVLRVRSVLGYRVRKAPVDLLRLVWFVLRGHGRWIGKAWTYCTYGDLRSDARTARVAGDAEARRKAQEMLRADSRARWARLGMVAERTWKAAGLVGVLALGLWLVDSMMSRAEMWPWLAGLYGVIEWAWSVAKTVGPVVAVAAPAGWLVATAYEGRDKSPGAGFLVRPDRDDADSWIDERMISQALAHLGISPLDKFFKDGGQLLYTVPARLDGNGTYAQIRLPMGVTADMVADRRDRLAGARLLHPHSGIMDEPRSVSRRPWRATGGQLGGLGLDLAGRFGWDAGIGG
jgi:S-DNA-T family DNA segregation ATPase FtsK/SpoIIIE